MQGSGAGLRSVALLLCVSFFTAAHLLGLAANGSLHGAVSDPSGARVVKATVTVQDADGHTSAVLSGADGTYVFPQLAPGTYVITVAAPGLALAQAQSVTVEAGRATVTNLALSIAVDQQSTNRAQGSIPARTITPVRSSSRGRIWTHFPTTPINCRMN
jgi:hypothetical protein